MLAFDVSDVYLTVGQGSLTVTSVRVEGQRLWFLRWTGACQVSPLVSGVYAILERAS